MLVNLLGCHLKEERLNTAARGGEVPMHFGKFSFGTLQIDGRTYEQDVVIERRDPQTQEGAFQEIP
jgi:hypothetical protein